MRIRLSPDTPTGDRFAEWSELLLREEWLYSIGKGDRFKSWTALEKASERASNFHPQPPRKYPRKRKVAA